MTIKSIMQQTQENRASFYRPNRPGNLNLIDINSSTNGDQPVPGNVNQYQTNYTNSNSQSYGINNNNNSTVLKSPHYVPQSPQINPVLINKPLNHVQSPHLNHVQHQQPQQQHASQLMSPSYTQTQTVNNYSAQYSPSYQPTKLQYTPNAVSTPNNNANLKNTNSNLMASNNYDAHQSYTPKFSPCPSSAHIVNKQTQYFNFDSQHINTLSTNSHIPQSPNHYNLNSQQQQQQQQQQQPKQTSYLTSNQLPRPAFNNLNYDNSSSKQSYGQFSKNYVNMPNSALPYLHHHSSITQTNTTNTTSHIQSNSLSVPNSPLIASSNYQYSHQNVSSTFQQFNTNQALNRLSFNLMPTTDNSVFKFDSTSINNLNSTQSNNLAIETNGTNDAVTDTLVTSDEANLLTTNTYDENDVEMAHDIINDIVQKEEISKDSSKGSNELDTQLVENVDESDGNTLEKLDDTTLNTPIIDDQLDANHATNNNEIASINYFDIAADESLVNDVDETTHILNSSNSIDNDTDDKKVLAQNTDLDAMYPANSAKLDLNNNQEIINHGNNNNSLSSQYSFIENSVQPSSASMSNTNKLGKSTSFSKLNSNNSSLSTTTARPNNEEQLNNMNNMSYMPFNQSIKLEPDSSSSSASPVTYLNSSSKSIKTKSKSASNSDLYNSGEESLSNSNQMVDSSIQYPPGPSLNQDSNSMFFTSQGCPECGKIFTNKSALAKHRLVHSDERKYTCHICEKSFKRQDHLNGHLLTHSDKKPFECRAPGCDKSYCDSRSLKRHVESQHQDYLALLAQGNQDAVNYLPRIGKIKANLAPNVQHEIIVSQNGDIIASKNSIVDDEKVSEPAQKIKNFFTFEEPKPEKCKICGKGFKNIPALNGHMRLHGGFVKPKVGSKGANEGFADEVQLNEDSMSSNCSSNTSFPTLVNASSLAAKRNSKHKLVGEAYLPNEDIEVNSKLKKKKLLNHQIANQTENEPTSNANSNSIGASNKLYSNESRNNLMSDINTANSIFRSSKSIDSSFQGSMIQSNVRKSNETHELNKSNSFNNKIDSFNFHNHHNNFQNHSYNNHHHQNHHNQQQQHQPQQANRHFPNDYENENFATSSKIISNLITHQNINSINQNTPNFHTIHQTLNDFSHKVNSAVAGIQKLEEKNVGNQSKKSNQFSNESHPNHFQPLKLINNYTANTANSTSDLMSHNNSSYKGHHDSDNPFSFTKASMLIHSGNSILNNNHSNNSGSSSASHIHSSQQSSSNQQQTNFPHVNSNCGKSNNAHHLLGLLNHTNSTGMNSLGNSSMMNNNNHNNISGETSTIERSTSSKPKNKPVPLIIPDNINAFQNPDSSNQNQQSTNQLNLNPIPYYQQLSANPAPLNIYPHATLLKSPRLLSYDLKNQYTPPPMLSPFRKGPGLYYKYLADMLLLPTLHNNHHLNQQSQQSNNRPFFNHSISTPYMYSPSMFYNQLLQNHMLQTLNNSTNNSTSLFNSNTNTNNNNNSKCSFPANINMNKKQHQDQTIKQHNNEDLEEKDESNNKSLDQHDKHENRDISKVKEAFDDLEEVDKKLESNLKPSLMRSRMMSQISMKSGNNEAFFSDESMTANEALTAALLDCAELSTKPKVNIGDDFQAKIPKLKELQNLNEYKDNMEDLMWSNETVDKVPTEQFNHYQEFVSKSSLINGSSNNLELGLHILHHFKGDISKSIKTFLNDSIELPIGHPITNYRYAETDIWTRNEIKLFENGILKHDKIFSEIANEVKTKNISQCVEFYYLWKKVMSDCVRKKWRYFKKNRYNFENQLELNLRSHKPTTVGCGEDDLKTNDENEIHQHSSSSPSPVTIYECNKCELTFKSKRKLNIHKNKH